MEAMAWSEGGSMVVRLFSQRKYFFFVKVNDFSKSYVFLHEMRFGIGFGIRNGLAFKRKVSLVQKQ